MHCMKGIECLGDAYEDGLGIGIVRILVGVMNETQLAIFALDVLRIRTILEVCKREKS